MEDTDKSSPLGSLHTCQGIPGLQTLSTSPRNADSPPRGNGREGARDPSGSVLTPPSAFPFSLGSGV